jgi:hypothetical protein
MLLNLKKMPRLIKPQAHPTPSLWHVLKGKMGLVNWEGKNQNPSKFVDTF